MDKDFKNPDGTYNGVELLSSLSGISQTEIKWTFDRLKALMKDGKSKEEAKAIVTQEAKTKPWEK